MEMHLLVTWIIDQTDALTGIERSTGRLVELQRSRLDALVLAISIIELPGELYQRSNDIPAARVSKYLSIRLWRFAQSN